MPRIIPFDECQLLDCSIGLLGIGSRSWYTCAGENFGDMSILPEQDACYALGEKVLIIDGPGPTVAEFTVIDRN